MNTKWLKTKQPMLGTPIEVQNLGMKEWHTQIYICSSEAGIVCVKPEDEENFKKGFSFRTVLWDKWRHI